MRLLDIKELDVKDQLGVLGDRGRGALHSIGKIGGNHKRALATDNHALKNKIPTLDDLISSKAELKRGSRLVRIKNGVVRGKTAGVPDKHLTKQKS